MDITSEAFKNAVADACRAGIESEKARIVELLTHANVHRNDLEAYTMYEVIELVEGKK